MPGLDPGIHDERPRAHQYSFTKWRSLTDCRVKPGNDLAGDVAAPGRLAELRDHLGRDRRGGDLLLIGLAAHHPDARLLAFHHHLAALQNPVLDVEGRAAEFRHARDDLHGVAEGTGPHEVAARYGIVGIGLEQAPRTGVEELEEARVEDDAGGIAMRPGDLERARVGEGSHRHTKPAAPAAVNVTTPY